MKALSLLPLVALVLAGCQSTETTRGYDLPTGKTKTIDTAAGPMTITAKDGPQKMGSKDKQGYTYIFDGTMTDWKVNENPGAWSIVEGALQANGNRSHCFYTGPLAPFKNFDLKVDVLTQPHSNGGIYIHTKYQESGWPWGGYETQVNQTHSDWRKSASVYSVQDVKEDAIKDIVQDGVWYEHRVVVKGNNIKVYLNGKLVNDYTEEPGRVAGKDFERKLNEGTFALQAHDPGSFVRYKNMRVKKLD
jgi:hypothetical protein